VVMRNVGEDGLHYIENATVTIFGSYICLILIITYKRTPLKHRVFSRHASATCWLATNCSKTAEQQYVVIVDEFQIPRIGTLPRKLPGMERMP
jgi:hypothetical protein